METHVLVFSKEGQGCFISREGDAMCLYIDYLQKVPNHKWRVLFELGEAVVCERVVTDDRE